MTFTVPPMTIIAGIFISRSKSYRLPIWIGWALMTIGTGLLATLHIDSSVAAGIGYPMIIGIGIGLVFSSLQFPILAPLDVALNARAISLQGFFRAFSQVCSLSL